MNYYETLGIKKDASQEDIQQAYRKKARECHPDVNSSEDATDQFKKVNEAFEVLNNPAKRSEYDLHGKVGGHGPSVSRYAHDDMMAHMFGFGHNVRRKQGRDIKVEVAIDLQEVLVGCKKDISVDRHSKCVMCMGQGAVDWKSCDACGGTGRKVLSVNPFRLEVACSVCHGGGKFPGKQCTDCKGTGWKINRKETLSVHIPPGVVDGMHLRLEGQGDEENGDRGDLYVMVTVKPHQFFIRQGNTDLLCSIPITFSELVFGTELDIPTLDGGKIKLKIPPKTAPGSKLRLAKQGLPFLGDNNRGNLLVVVDLDIPDNGGHDYANKVSELAALEKTCYGSKRKSFNQLL